MPVPYPRMKTGSRVPDARLMASKFSPMHGAPTPACTARLPRPRPPACTKKNLRTRPANDGVVYNGRVPPAARWGSEFSARSEHYTILTQMASASVTIIADTVAGWREAGHPLAME